MSRKRVANILSVLDFFPYWPSIDFCLMKCVSCTSKVLVLPFIGHRLSTGPDCSWARRWLVPCRPGSRSCPFSCARPDTACSTASECRAWWYNRVCDQNKSGTKTILSLPARPSSPTGDSRILPLRVSFCILLSVRDMHWPCRYFHFPWSWNLPPKPSTKSTVLSVSSPSLLSRWQLPPASIREVFHWGAVSERTICFYWKFVLLRRVPLGKNEALKRQE